MLKRCLRGARGRPEALPAARGPGPDLRRQEPADRRRRPTREAQGGAASRRPSPRSTRSTRSGCSRPTRWTSTTCWSAPSTLLELFEEVRERWRRTFRHVLVDEYQDTNHAQYRLLQLLAAEHGNLMVVGDEDQSVYGFRHADIRNILDFERDFPDADGGQARAELPLDPDDPLRRQRGRRPQPRAAAEAALDRVGRRRAGAARRARRRARGGALGRRRDRAAGRGGGRARATRSRSSTGPTREPGAGGHAGPLRAALPGDRRHQVLRAGRDQGRGRLPQPARQPRRRGLLRADRQLAAARDRQHQPGRGSLAHANTTGQDDLGGRCRSRRRCPGLGAAAIKAVARFPETMEALRERPSDGRPGRRAAARRCCTRAATWRRSRPSGRSRPRGGSRTSRSWSASPPSSTPTASSEGDERGAAAGGVPAADLPLHRAGRAPRRREPGAP